MPLHRPRLDPRPDPDGHGGVDQDAPHARHPARIPAFHPQVLAVREAAQEPRGARVAGVSGRGGRFGDGGAVSAVE